MNHRASGFRYPTLLHDKRHYVTALFVRPKHRRRLDRDIGETVEYRPERSTLSAGACEEAIAVSFDEESFDSVTRFLEFVAQPCALVRRDHGLVAAMVPGTS